VQTASSNDRYPIPDRHTLPQAVTSVQFPAQPEGVAQDKHLPFLENSQAGPMSALGNPIVDMEVAEPQNNISRASVTADGGASISTEAVVLHKSIQSSLAALLVTVSITLPCSLTAFGKSLNKKLSPEIHLLIFDYIDSPVASACLGLTCKAFYKIHRARRGRVSLRDYIIYGLPEKDCLTNLGLLLKNCIPSHLAFDYKDGKFVTSTTLAKHFIAREDHEIRLTGPLRYADNKISEGEAREEEFKSILKEKDRDVLVCLDHMETREEMHKAHEAESAVRIERLEG
jgi:hypothetical protein